jgi:hypothetical protein
MPESPAPSFTPNELRLLRHEAFLAAAMRVRQGTPSSVKSPFQWFLESSGGTAAITVVLGGILGTIVTGMIQVGMKDREFQQAWLKTRGDQAITAYKEHVTAQVKAVEGALLLIGQMQSSADNLIILTEPRFNPEGTQPVRAQRIRQRDEIKKEFNAQSLDWRAKRELTGFLLVYYHRDAQSVREAWERSKESVDRFRLCAANWETSKPFGTVTRDACGPERSQLTSTLLGLEGVLRESSAYAWDGWEAPDRMKALLSKTPQ